jgi:hypothetical protein
LSGIQTLHKGYILKCLGERVAGCSISFEFDNDNIAFSVDTEEVNETPEISGNLTTDDKDSSVFQNAVWIGFEPFFQNDFFVIGLEGSLNVFTEFAVRLYAVDSHVIFSRMVSG